MKILVTGADGFIGSHVVGALLQRGYSVRALVHYNSLDSWGHLEGFKKNPVANLDVRLGDITDSHFVRSIIEGCDTVLHLAALIGIPYSYIAPASYVATNLGGTLNVLEACRLFKIRRVVVTSTSEVYGTACYAPINESHPLQAQSPYAASKIAADKLAESYFCSYDLPIVILRPFNTYGPRQSARALIPCVLAQAIAGAKKIKLGNLEPRRDLTYVTDTAEAFVLAAEIPGIEGETIHFGQGVATSVKEIARKCLELTGNSDVEIISIVERQRPDRSEVGLLLCDATKAKRLLGWSPKITFDEGLHFTISYIRNHLKLYQLKDYVI